VPSKLSIQVLCAIKPVDFLPGTIALPYGSGKEERAGSSSY
jgi:hypothetical protein